ncbi:glycosyltransferase family 4 protein [Patescibacteria group bacterium]|nr:glycosyltransferase family 4 protein [Patescibacteria group bacterium]
MRINIISEKFVGTANGVYTAYVELLQVLKNKKIQYTVNGSNSTCDVIHSETIGPKYILASLRHKHKMIVSAHVVPDSFDGSLVFSTIWKPLAKWYLKIAYNRAQTVIAVSPQVKKELEILGVTSSIVVLCNSVDRETFKPDNTKRDLIRSRLKISKDAFVILSVGQIQPRKGVRDFVAVARKLPNATFVWVGGRPYGKLTAGYAELSEIIENHPSNVIFTETVEYSDMPGYYAAADVYFMPSHHENFSFATIEASATHLPLVLRDIKEYRNSLFAHYLKGKDVDSFTLEISKLHTDLDYLHTWQDESDALARKYDMDSFAKKLIEVYASI